MIETSTAETSRKICESCGAEFECGAGTEECWCFRVTVEPESLAEIQAKYQDCLCEACLDLRAVKS